MAKTRILISTECLSRLVRSRCWNQLRRMSLRRSWLMELILTWSGKGVQSVFFPVWDRRHFTQISFWIERNISIRIIRLLSFWITLTSLKELGLELLRQNKLGDTSMNQLTIGRTQLTKNAENWNRINFDVIIINVKTTYCHVCNPPSSTVMLL